MKTYPFNRSTFRMHGVYTIDLISLAKSGSSPLALAKMSRPIHTKKLKSSTENNQNLGTKCRVAQFGNLYLLCL